MVQCPVTAVMEAAVGPEGNRLDAHLEILPFARSFLTCCEPIPIQRIRCFRPVRFIPLCCLSLGPLKGSCPGTCGALNNLMSVLEQVRVVTGKRFHCSRCPAKLFGILNGMQLNYLGYTNTEITTANSFCFRKIKYYIFLRARGSRTQFPSEKFLTCFWKELHFLMKCTFISFLLAFIL